jgi:hypothetical protein
MKKEKKIEQYQRTKGKMCAALKRFGSEKKKYKKLQRLERQETCFKSYNELKESFLQFLTDTDEQQFCVCVSERLN